MSKLTKHAEILAAIQAQVKTAAEKQSTEIVKAESTPVPAVAQNEVKPESLNSKQAPKQEKAPVEVIHKKSEDEAPIETPAATPAPEKKAEVKEEAHTDLQKAAKEILDMVEKMANKAVESPKVESTPVPSVEQNSVKPEELSPKQTPVQKPATQPAVPAKKAEEIDAEKVASYEFGKLLAEMSIKEAQDRELAIYKQAGRRDFEQIVNMAAQAMEQKQAVTKQAAVEAPEVTEKQAEEAGKEAFRNLYKQAQTEYSVAQIAEENKKLQEKIASIESAKQAEIEQLKKQAADSEAKYAADKAEQREAEKFARLADIITSNVTSNVMAQMKSELLKH